MKPMQCRLSRIWKVLTRKSWTANFRSSQLSFVIWIGNFTSPVCLTSVQVQNTPGYSTPPQIIHLCNKFIRTSSYMVSTQYFRTHTGSILTSAWTKLGGHFAFILIFPYNLFHGGEPIFSGITLRLTNTWFKYKLLFLKWKITG